MGRERLQHLSRRLVEVQEAERRHIAYALHNEAGQMLASVRLALEAAVATLPSRYRHRFQPISDHLDAIDTQLRRLAHELRPTILDDLGLLPALRFLAQGITARTGLRVTIEGTLRERLPADMETALYRIVQEALGNATKHAQATHLRIHLQCRRQQLSCTIQDDGVGFEVPAVLERNGRRGLGLLSIQERVDTFGGLFQIISAPGQGTTLRITLPLIPKVPP